MNTEYRKTKTTSSLLIYHFVFCPRYKRRIFDIPDVTERFIEVVKGECKEIEVTPLKIECFNDHVYLLLSCTPSMSPKEIVFRIKAATTKELIQSFSKLSQMKSLWTRNYFVSTEKDVNKNEIEEFLEKQRKRY